MFRIATWYFLECADELFRVAGKGSSRMGLGKSPYVTVGVPALSYRRSRKQSPSAQNQTYTRFDLQGRGIRIDIARSY